MHSTTLTIGVIQDHPRAPASAQRRALIAYGIPERDLVTLGQKLPSGKRVTWDWLVKHKFRSGDTMAVTKLRVIYAPHGKLSPLKAIYLRLHQVEDAGVKIVEISTGRRGHVQRERDMMVADFREAIARSRAGGDAGRPAREWTPAEREIVERHWYDARHKTNAEAFAAIKADAKRAGLTSLASLRNRSGCFSRSP